MPGTWRPLENQPPGCDSTLLLTDGRVLCHDAASPEAGRSGWHMLTPSVTGSYVNGSWSQLEDGPRARPTSVSTVLNDGRVLTAGGGLGAAGPVAQIYDPVADSWDELDLPTGRGGGLEGWHRLDGAPSCLLADGRVLFGEPASNRTAIFDPARGNWVRAGTGGAKKTISAAENWTLLQDGTVLTVECSNAGFSQRYIPAADAWIDAGPTGPILVQPPEAGARTGPAVLLPDGRVFVIGAVGNTALYAPSPASGATTWAAGPILTSGGESDALLMAADLDGDGTVEVMVANQAEGWMQVRKWNGAALVPVWMSPSPLHGPAGSWDLGEDGIVAADVDGDGHVEIVIANQADGRTGLLKWNGAALVLVWAGPSPRGGPAINPDRGQDILIAVDLDGDGRVEIVIANNLNGWTGVLKWDGAAMALVSASPRTLTGPAGSWNRGEDDFTAADVDGDGRIEIVVSSKADGRTGLLKWDGAALCLVWASPSPLDGPAGKWKRGRDAFTAADVDGDGRVEIMVVDEADNSAGLLKWDGATLRLVWAGPSPMDSPAGNWNREPDSFTAADVDGDGQVEIVVASGPGRTGVLKWVAGALQLVWLGDGPLAGAATTWTRGPIDRFIAADIDHDGRVELVVANDDDGQAGLLGWTGAGLAPLWTAPDLNLLRAEDGPASLLPNGRVLFSASVLFSGSAGPAADRPGRTQFMEFSPDTGSLVKVPGPPGEISGRGRLLLLPSGQVLFSSKGGLQLYTPGDGPQDVRRPMLHPESVPHSIALGSSIRIGEDAWTTTGPRFVRVRHRHTGELAYCPTSSHLGIVGATGMTSVMTDVSFPASLLPGPSDMVVVANGIASEPVAINLTSVGLLPIWASASPLNVPPGNASRGDDRFIAADLDGDGQVELVIVNNVDGWTGVLKWDGAELGPVWASPSPLTGPGGSWSRGDDRFIAADLDGDGRAEIVVASGKDGWTGMLRWDGAALGLAWASASPLNGPAGEWHRGRDSFTAADVDGDGCTEIVAVNRKDGWTGVLKWDGAALGLVSASSRPQLGPARNWRRGQDSLIAADLDGDGQVEIVVANNADGWTSVLKWNGLALAPLWATPSPLSGPAGNWSRGDDAFIAADVDGDGRVEIVIANRKDGWTSVLRWNGTALSLAWANASPLQGPAGDWRRGEDSFTAADVDGDGRVEIVIANQADGWTGVLKWNGTALVLVWASPSPLDGPAGSWQRGLRDTFIAADVDHDGRVETVVANRTDGWAGLAKWMQ